MKKVAQFCGDTSEPVPFDLHHYIKACLYLDLVAVINHFSFQALRKLILERFKVAV